MINIHDKVLRVAWWVLAFAVFGLTLTIRIRLLGIPLERDEYVYAGNSWCRAFRRTDWPT
jgi:hypothetical protein